MKKLVAIVAIALPTPGLAHDPLQFAGDQIHVVLDSEVTKGAMGMFSIKSDDAGGPPMHVHHDADEAFYIVDGNFELAVGEERLMVGPGEAGFAPKGAPHSFRFADDNGGTIVVIVAPGGFEGFFQAVLDADLTLPEDMDQLNKISEGFNQSFVGPPLGAE